MSRRRPDPERRPNAVSGNAPDWSFQDLQGRSFAGADLRCAQMRRADLRGCNLGKADLRGADLSGTDCRQACLAGADLRGARMTDALLRQADLQGARWDDDTCWPADFLPDGRPELIYARRSSPTPAGAAWRWGFWLVVAATVALDQGTKKLAASALTLNGDPVWLIPNLFYLRQVHNRGVAFSLFADAALGQLVFGAIVAGLIAVFYVPSHYSGRPLRPVAALGYSLLLGGTLGNLIDRVQLGRVIDFLGVDRLCVLNIADLCVLGGILTLLSTAERAHIRLRPGGTPAPPGPECTGKKTRRRPSPIYKPMPAESPSDSE